MISRLAISTSLALSMTWGIGLYFCNPAWGSDLVPGELPKRPIAIVNARIHPVSAPMIESGTLVFEGETITAVGPRETVNIPDSAQRIPGEGLSVYPGLIDADTALGLVEIEAVRATVDTAETGQINPNVEARVAFNPDSELIPVARSDGVLLALSVPQGSFVTGLSALMQLDGWNAHDMALKPIVGLHVRWPPAVFIPAWNVEPSMRERVKHRAKRLRELEQLLTDTRAYLAAGADETRANLRLEAMARVTRREIPLFVHADELREIQEAVAFAEQHRLRLVIVGGYDAPQCADLLKQQDVPVIVTGTMRLPLRPHSPIDEPFLVPSRLSAAQVRFCIAGLDRFSASAIRNLPQHAGMAVAHGLSPEEALRSITLSSAEILGVADQVGSLEPGKQATLIVADGDILEIPTRVQQAFIAGRPVDLDNRQKRLYRKYREKLRRMIPAAAREASSGTSAEVGRSAATED